MFASRLRAMSMIRKRTFSLWSIGGLAALTMSFVGLQAANYTVIPGVRGYELTIPLDEPLPMYAPQPNAAATESVGLGDEVPMPTPIDAAGNAIPAPAAPQQMPTTPFSIPSRFDTGPAAAPYVFKGKTAADTLRAAICLTSAIYYEAASESDDGQRAVAQVILNRVRHPAWPSTVCGVIYQGSDMPGCQFSYACDGSMARVPSRDGWALASRAGGLCPWAGWLGDFLSHPGGQPDVEPVAHHLSGGWQSHLLPYAGDEGRDDSLLWSLCRWRALSRPVAAPHALADACRTRCVACAGADKCRGHADSALPDLSGHSARRCYLRGSAF